MSIDWEDPAARAALIERVGVQTYNQLFKKHCEATTVATVNGYPIRQIHSLRWGTFYLVEGLGAGYPELEDAKQLAAASPPKTAEL